MKLAAHEGFKIPWVNPVPVRVRSAAPVSLLGKTHKLR